MTNAAAQMNALARRIRKELPQVGKVRAQNVGSFGAIVIEDIRTPFYVVDDLRRWAELEVPQMFPGTKPSNFTMAVNALGDAIVINWSWRG